MLVVDEAYWRFVFPHEAYSAVELVEDSRRRQVIVLRSMTKDFALAGLRLGYAVATPAVAERLGAQLPSWNVNGVAQAAGVAALTDRADPGPWWRMPNRETWPAMYQIRSVSEA